MFRFSDPFALVALIAKTAFSGKPMKNIEESDRTLLEIKLNLLREMLSKEFPKNKIRGLINFLTYYIRFEKKETNRIFEQAKQKLTGGSKIRMSRSPGWQKSAKNMLRNLENR